MNGADRHSPVENARELGGLVADFYCSLKEQYPEREERDVLQFTLRCVVAMWCARPRAQSVVTDAHGMPLAHPKSANFSSTDEFIDALRAYWARKDHLASLANEAFDRGFKAALKRKGKAPCRG